MRILKISRWFLEKVSAKIITCKNIILYYNNIYNNKYYSKLNTTYITNPKNDYIKQYIQYFYIFLNEQWYEISWDTKSKLDTVFERLKENFKNKERLSGEPYITHLIEVAKIYIDTYWCISLDDIIIALLHDSIEDITHENFHAIQSDFWNYVALWVLALSKPDIWENPDQKEREKRNHEYHKRFQSLETVKSHIEEQGLSEGIKLKDADLNRLSIIVWRIKICDRIHNLKTMPIWEGKEGFSYEKKRQKISESLGAFSKLDREIHKGANKKTSDFWRAIISATQSLYKQAWKESIR